MKRLPVLNLLPVKVVLAGQSLGTGTARMCRSILPFPCSGTLWPISGEPGGSGAQRSSLSCQLCGSGLVGEWLEPPQLPGELGGWAQPLLGTGRGLGGRCEVLRGRRAAGAGHSRQTLVLLAKPLLISGSSDTWLGLAPLHPHPSPKSALESSPTAGSGGTVPSAALTLGDGAGPCPPPAPSRRLHSQGSAMAVPVPLTRCSSSGASCGACCPGTALPRVAHLVGGTACLRGRLQGCPLQCAALSVSRSPLLCAAFPALSVAQLWYSRCPWLWPPCTHPDAGGTAGQVEGVLAGQGGWHKR